MAIWTYPQVPVLQQDLIQNPLYSNRIFDAALGRNPSVNNTRVDVWGGPTGTYVFPLVAQQMQVVSTNVNDTLAGTGAQKVHIHYLDNTYTEQTEVINMNGTTPVSTVATNILRINALHVSQVGSNNVPLGAISLTNLGGTVTYGFIEAGYNTARQAVYTIPAGKTGYISHWQCSSGTASGTHFTQFDLRSTSHYGAPWPGVFIAMDSMGTLNSGAVITFPTPIRVPALTDVKVSAVSDAANAAAVCNAVVMGWYE